MFDSIQYDDSSATPQYPKTLNQFYNPFTNSTLQPWNKTYHPDKKRSLPQSSNNVIKFRANPSRESKGRKNSQKSTDKKKVELNIPVLSFYFSHQQEKSELRHERRKSLNAGISKHRKFNKSEEKSTERNSSIQFLNELNEENKGLKNTINPTALLKKRHNEKIRFKQIILKKEMQNKFVRNFSSMVAQHRNLDRRSINNHSATLSDVGVDTILHDTMSKNMKPKKALFVGMRKIVNKN